MTYIERETVYKLIDKNVCVFDSSGIDIKNQCLEAIKTIQTADVVEVVHAAWMWGEICSSKGYCCTNCGVGFTGENAEWIAKEHKYCPNCGAKMDGERREE